MKRYFQPPKKLLPQKSLPSNDPRKLTFRSLFAGGKERLEARRKQIVHRLPKKNVGVFGNQICNLPLYSPSSIPMILPSGIVSDLNEHHILECGVPEFVVRCLRRIETMKTYDGLYRINGDAEEVQKLK